MRLIDADKIIEVLEEVQKHAINGKMKVESAISIISIQNTAYDLDKVLEELKELKKRDCMKLYPACIGCLYTEVCYSQRYADYVKMEKAIEIVKAGGKNDI